jgi:hypothetical protein
MAFFLPQPQHVAVKIIRSTPVPACSSPINVASPSKQCSVVSVVCAGLVKASESEQSVFVLMPVSNALQAHSEVKTIARR